MSPRLSVVMIARDEERDLPDCLNSLRALEAEIVIVVDDRSSDQTKAAARRFTSHVFERTFDNYAAQKQSALERAAGEWVLSIDADERVSAELSAELLALCAEGDNGIAGYQIPFAVHFMGRHLRHGGLGGERHLRLFRRAAGRFVGGSLHEGIEVTGAIRRTRGAIVHRPYRDLDEYLDKMTVYTTNAARKRREAGRRFTVLHHLLPCWEFFRRTVLRLGILDGTPGIVWAGLSAFHTWVKYLKLRELERNA